MTHPAYLVMQLALLWQSKMSLHGMNQILFCTATRGKQLQNSPKTRDVVRLFLILTDLTKHRDPVCLIICVRQAMYTTSTTGTCIACFFLLRTFACKVTDLATVLASTFCLASPSLGFVPFPWPFLPFLPFLSTPFLAALMPTILREVTLLPAHVTDSILREYAQIHWRWT